LYGLFVYFERDAFQLVDKKLVGALGSEHPRLLKTNNLPGAAPYGFQGVDFDFLLPRLLAFDPSPLFLGSSASHQLQ